jgi:hypothetical protein
MTLRPLALSLALAFAAAPAFAADWSLVNVVETDATTADALKLKKGVASSANLNRFGFYSDLAYDAASGEWFALADRGPGGGLIDYATRVERIRVPFDAATGAIGQPVILQTTLFKGEDGQVFNGLNPLLLAGDRTQLGFSFDPEGLAVGRGGHFFVADEYGPSVYEFTSSGQFIRALAVPANLRPREAGNLPNFVDGRPIVVEGRQDNRGFEGLTFNASGTRLYGVMQDPLVNEGSNNDGRRSRNVRVVEFDAETGEATRQFAYQLESRSVLNAIDPDTGDDFSASNQGRSIGLSAITALSDSEFLVIERDNRGLGVEETATPLHKRVYRIDISGATDISAIPLAGSDALPGDVVPVQKAPELDVLAALAAQGLEVPEKLEGLAIGPRLADGRHLVLLGTDNDFSVTQTGAGEQFEVCVNRTDGSRAQVPLDADCPAGMARIPGMLMAFAVDFSAD